MDAGDASDARPPHAASPEAAAAAAAVAARTATDADVDVNLVGSLLQSFAAQGGGAGPASTLLGGMGLALPRDVDA